jgi:hypothetical protein
LLHRRGAFGRGHAGCPPGGRQAEGRQAGEEQGGKGKPKKLPSARTIRAEGGTRVTIEYRKGVDDAVILAALREILAKLEGAGGDQAAA